MQLVDAREWESGTVRQPHNAGNLKGEKKIGHDVYKYIFHPKKF